MFKGPCFIARFPGDDRVEKQQEEARKQLIIQVNRKRRLVRPNRQVFKSYEDDQ